MFICADHRQPVDGYGLPVQDIGGKQLSRCFVNGNRHIEVLHGIPKGQFKDEIVLQFIMMMMHVEKGTIGPWWR